MLCLRLFNTEQNVHLGKWSWILKIYIMQIHNSDLWKLNTQPWICPLVKVRNLFRLTTEAKNNYTLYPWFFCPDSTKRTLEKTMRHFDPFCSFTLSTNYVKIKHSRKIHRKESKHEQSMTHIRLMYKDTVMKPIALYVSPPKSEKPKLYSELNKGRQPIILQSSIGWTSN